MKAIEAYESFKSMNDQRSKSLSTLFLNIETVSYSAGCTTPVAVLLPRNIMAIVRSENICLFNTVEAAKSAQSGEGAPALYPDERLKDETDLAGISWALGTQCMTANSF